MAANFDNILRFKYGENFIENLRKTTNPIKSQNGTIYFDSANRQIILGQDNTASNGQGTGYKIYSDLYQTLFYSEASYNKTLKKWIIKIYVADVTVNFLQNNMTSLRIYFKDDMELGGIRDCILITESDYPANNSTTTISSKGVAATILTTNLTWSENSFLDFMYLPPENEITGGAAGQLELLKTNTAINIQGNAETATSLKNGRSLQVALGSTNPSSLFNGTSNVHNIGVSGILGIGNGGTGANTANGAFKNITYRGIFDTHNINDLTLERGEWYIQGANSYVDETDADNTSIGNISGNLTQSLQTKFTWGSLLQLNALRTQVLIKSNRILFRDYIPSQSLWQSWQEIAHFKESDTRAIDDIVLAASATTGALKTVTILPIKSGGTGTSSFTNNRLAYIKDNVLYSGYHYADTQHIAINSAVAPTENFYVKGLAKISDTLETANLTVTNSGGFNYSGIETATGNTSRPIWFARSTTNGTPCYNENFTYNPSTRVLSQLDNNFTISSTSTLYLQSGNTASIILKRGSDNIIQLDPNNSLRPVVNDSYELGDASHKWSTVYATLFQGNLQGNLYGHVIIKHSSDSSRYSRLVQFENPTATEFSQWPQIGHHNTGDTDGALILLPYATNTDPWNGNIGLYIGKNNLKWEGKNIALTTDITSAIDALDKDDTAVAGQYVSAVTEKNGIITVSRASFSPSIEIGEGTDSNAPTINVKVNSKSGTPQSITKATTEAYGVTKLNNTVNSTSTNLAATANAVKLTYDKAIEAYNLANTIQLQTPLIYYTDKNKDNYITTDIIVSPNANKWIYGTIIGSRGTSNGPGLNIRFQVYWLRDAKENDVITTPAHMGTLKYYTLFNDATLAVGINSENKVFFKISPTVNYSRLRIFIYTDNTFKNSAISINATAPENVTFVGGQQMGPHINYYDNNNTGYEQLVLGNNIDKGTINSKRGELILYTQKEKWIKLIPEESSIEHTITLPAADGTVALKENTIDKDIFSTLKENRLMWTKSDGKIYAGKHYANDTRIAINYYPPDSPSESNPDLSAKSTLYINGNITATKAHFTAVTDASGTAKNTPALIIGPETGEHLEFDTNEIMAKATDTTTGPLYLNYNGGTVYIGDDGLSVTYLRKSPAIGENAENKRIAGARLTFYSTPNADGAGTYSNHNGWVGSSANGNFYGLYSVTKSKYLVVMDTNTGNVALKGNADTATALTTDNGGPTLPVYFTDGKPATINDLDLERNNSTATYMRVGNSNGQVQLYVSTNRGLYDTTKGSWIIKRDKDVETTYVPNWDGIGNSSTPVYFSGGKPIVLDYSFTKTTPSSSSTDTTVPTSKAVWAAIASGIAANDALVYKGAISSNASLPIEHKQGWTYRVNASTPVTIAGQTAEKGDLVICITDSAANATAQVNSHWTIIQTNIDGALFMASNTFTDGRLLIADGTNGKIKTANVPSTTNVIKTVSLTGGAVPTLGTAIAADDITSWNAGSLPSLSTTTVDIPNVTAKTDPTVSYVTTTEKTVVTAVNQATSTSSSIGQVQQGVLVLQLAVTAVGAVTPTTGKVNSATATDVTVSKVTLGTAVKALKTATLTPGSLPTLSYTARSIPNVTDVGILPELNTATQAVITSIT